jgi:hypothetical protein
MEIYAELSKKLCERFRDDNFFRLPSGVSLSRKPNSRYCHFFCDDNASEDLIDILEFYGIPWQEN